MGTVTSLAEYRKKKQEANGLCINTEEEYDYYSSELRSYKQALAEMDANYPPPNDPNDPKRMLFIDFSRRQYQDTIEVLDKALHDYADRNFKPALLKAVEDGDLLTALPTALPESLILRTRVTLAAELVRLAALVDQLKKEIDNTVPFREELVEMRQKYYTSYLKVKRVLVVNGWFKEDNV